MGEPLRRLSLLVGMAFRTDPWRSLGTLLEPLGVLAIPLFGLWLKLLVDGVVTGDSRMVTGGVAGMTATVAMFYLSAFVGNQLRVRLSESVGFAFDREIAQVTAALPGLEHHEREDYQNQLELLRQYQGAVGRSLYGVVSAVNGLVCGAGALVLLAVVDPALMLIALFAVPAIPIAAVQQRWMGRAEEQSAAPSRLARHLRELTVDRNAGMELRVFGLQREIMTRLRSAWFAGRAPLRRATGRVAWTNAAREVVYGLGFSGAVAFILWQAARGRATVGDVVMAVYVCQRTQWLVVNAIRGVAILGRVLRAAGRLLWLRDYAQAVTARAPRPRPAPAVLTGGITFEQVSFRYPGSRSWVLRDLTLRLPPGTVVALVGANGAGKTTLVKLLCAMYEPTEGRILVDGTPLSDIDPVGWRARLAAAFQDFTRFELLAREGVGVGDLPRIDDDEAVVRALARAGAADLLGGLPEQGGTQLGSRWDGGVDLSTGQWQKLALGRALMRDAPLVTFFDEPTASLDAPTEHALFEGYAEAARTRSANGSITVLVSHRFSTVRTADLVMVIDGGRVVESGTHDQLMADRGLYRRLYSLQADAYRTPPEVPSR